MFFLASPCLLPHWSNTKTWLVVNFRKIVREYAPRARGRLALGTRQIGLWEIACEDARAYRFSLKGIMHVKDTRKRPQYSLLNHTIVFSSRKYYVVSVLWTPKCFYEGSFRLWLETLFIHLKYTFLMSPSCFLFYFVSFRYSPSREYAKINT